MLSILTALRIGIIGGKFGIYGFLPAALDLFPYVYLAERHKDFLNARSDLNKFSSRVILLQNEKDIIANSDIVIFSVPPALQKELILKNIDNLRDKRIILEKPLTETPVDSIFLLNLLNEKKVDFRINYTFLQTDWFNKIKNNLNHLKSDSLFIYWHFEAHHFRENLNIWKKYHNEGGGCLRFFSIHLVAVLSALGFELDHSRLFFIEENVPVKWSACFKKNSSGQNAHILVDSKSDNDMFNVVLKKSGKKTFEQFYKDPFHLDFKTKYNDSRSFFLFKMLEEFRENANDDKKNYDKVNDLWFSIESLSKVVILNDMS